MLELDYIDQTLIGAVQGGLPLCSRPYAEIGERLGLSEAQVLERLNGLRERGAIKRMGLVVRHHELGYRANAMVVWNIEDARVNELGHCFSQFEFITLCYRRPRRLPDWPYNLFCMIHGHDREGVLQNLTQMINACGVGDIERTVLFSTRRFKQRGARYVHGPHACTDNQGSRP